MEVTRSTVSLSVAALGLAWAGCAQASSFGSGESDRESHARRGPRLAPGQQGKLPIKSTAPRVKGVIFGHEASTLMRQTVEGDISGQLWRRGLGCIGRCATRAVDRAMPKGSRTRTSKGGTGKALRALMEDDPLIDPLPSADPLRGGGILDTHFFDHAGQVLIRLNGSQTGVVRWKRHGADRNLTTRVVRTKDADEAKSLSELAVVESLMSQVLYDLRSSRLLQLIKNTADGHRILEVKEGRLAGAERGQFRRRFSAKLTGISEDFGEVVYHQGSWLQGDRIPVWVVRFTSQEAPE